MHPLSRPAVSRLIFASALTFAALPGDVAGRPPAPLPAARVHFAFHSGFLMNLHHVLFDLATHADRLEEWTSAQALSAPEESALREAVGFYRANYAGRDLLFDDTMAEIKRALSGDDALHDPRGLPLAPGLIHALQLAAPVYAAHAWAGDDAANRAWIARVETLDERYGEPVQAAIERGMGGSFPRQSVRIDLVRETGKRQGAYTDLQAVIPAGRANYQGLASLEMLYHEASHVQTTDALERKIAQRLAAAGKPADSELWHVLQFYTVGAAVEDTLRQRDGVAYVQYADKVGLFGGYWAPFVPLIDSEWKPWLQGRQSMDAAIEHMVARLPSTN